MGTGRVVDRYFAEGAWHEKKHQQEREQDDRPPARGARESGTGQRTGREDGEGGSSAVSTTGGR